jgi:hypothetical protein
VARKADVDVWFYDQNGEPIELCSDDPNQLVCQIPGFDANVGGDAVETPIMVNFSDEDIECRSASSSSRAPSPNYVKYVWFDLDAGVFSVDEYDTASGTVYGHANAAGAEAGRRSRVVPDGGVGQPASSAVHPALS